MDNLASVFQYSAKDISDVLNTIDLVVACGIRNSVVESAILKFPQLKDHKVPQRTVIHTAVKDIVSIGFSVANGSLTKDAERVFCKAPSGTSGQGDDTAAEIERLLQTVVELTTRVVTLENTVEALQNDNAAIQKQVQECVETKNTIQTCSEILPVSTECDVESMSHNETLTSDTEGDSFEIPRSQKRKARRKRRQETKRQESALQASADGSKDTGNTNNTSQLSREETKQVLGWN